jgi:hypothetical protein
MSDLITSLRKLMGFADQQLEQMQGSVPPQSPPAPSDTGASTQEQVPELEERLRRIEADLQWQKSCNYVMTGVCAINIVPAIISQVGRYAIIGGVIYYGTAMMYPDLPLIQMSKDTFNGLIRRGIAISNNRGRRED